MRHHRHSRGRASTFGACLLLAALGTACDPEVVVRHSPLQPEPGQSVTFRVDVEDTAAIDRIEIWVNGARIKSCTGQKECRQSIVLTGEEFHIVEYEARAVNVSGGEASDGPYYFTTGQAWGNHSDAPPRSTSPPPTES